MRISVQDAIDRLSNDVVAIPTETVYGLAARIDAPQAIEKVFTLKKRPRENPLIVHLYSHKELYHYTDESIEDELIDYWPGPLTFILKCKNLSETITAGLSTAAFRVPNHPLTLEIIKKTGPLVAPSANLSGYPSATHYKHVENDFGIDFPVVDGGMCESGLESTIIAKSQGKWRILRLGAISQEALEKKLGYKPEIVKPSSKPECPGQLFK
ncbi:MAG: L-threonylcarbamoyladenylate synthase, partial [Parachlamydiaceae bacterium]